MLFFGYGAKPDTKLVYDETVDTSSGLWVCPKCGSKFYGGGKAIHNRGCPSDGYDGCEKHFGPSQVEQVKKLNQEGHPDQDWYGLTYTHLAAQFPELVADEG